MEKAVHSRPVSEEDEALSCSKKLKLEGSMSSEDPEKYILFTDSEYKLPFYLSEFALSEFNSKKETKYEKVNVIKAMKSLGVEKETTYLVIFEASLPNDRSYNVQTFQAKIYMSALEPTTKIKIKFVMIKPSEFVLFGEESSKEDSEKVLCDKSDKKDNEEKLSELDKKDPEVMLSEFAEKDTEEKLSDFNVQDSSPEKLAETDEKYAEKKLAEIDGKDSAQELAKINVKTSAEENLVVRKTPKRRSSQNKKGPEYYKEVKQYSMDLAKSDGFEVGIYPHMSYSCCMIQCYYNPPNRNLSTAYLNQLVYLSQLAIYVYNMKEVTNYDNVKVLKAMVTGCGHRTYKITFEASLSDRNSVTFQTEISTSLPFPYHEIEIIFVRIKPCNNPFDIAH